MENSWPFQWYQLIPCRDEEEMSGTDGGETDRWYIYQACGWSFSWGLPNQNNHLIIHPLFMSLLVVYFARMKRLSCVPFPKHVSLFVETLFVEFFLFFCLSSFMFIKRMRCGSSIYVSVWCCNTLVVTSSSKPVTVLSALHSIAQLNSDLALILLCVCSKQVVWL